MITFVIFYKNYTGNLRNQTFFTRSKIFTGFEKKFYEILNIYFPSLRNMITFVIIL